MQAGPVRVNPQFSTNLVINFALVNDNIHIQGETDEWDRLDVAEIPVGRFLAHLQI